ncbi:hypothetical protein H257_02986 [Aphanomyces astaci]|uniref:Chloride conductance regulatory protein ICln n=1 Tax=Aphanomyces astaci TaxID=112090 RepID=W4H0P8_APHAT|nr:hypothetical protein H257_02986 [Aphanomyces astaci]ETV85141.1 hypothetical protein H257_02986 [Aphanomyces astaci]|eukprot:XP_009825159.1 hypothetical protein H257_02986 [Aphanomyces astaci]
MNALHLADVNGTTGAPVLDADEHVLATFLNVRMYTNTYGSNDDDDASPSMESKGTGNLYVTSARVAWIFGQESEGVVGYAWDMTFLSLHAISRDTSSFPEPCLYCQLDVDDEVNEIRFVPCDVDKQLQAMFDAFSASAALNPDDDDDDEPQGGDWIYNEDEVVNGAREANLAAHFDSILQVVPSLDANVAGQFDDASDDESLL